MPTVNLLNGGQISVDLEARDFESYRSDILDAGGLADTFTPFWTDRSELDLGVAIVEAFGFFGDVLSYYQDRCANEALFLPAVQRKSIIEHCRLLGYELHPNTSASVECTIVTNAAGTLPKLTQVLSSGNAPAVFELAADFIAAAPGTYTGVVAYHGVTRTDLMGSGTGGPGQRFRLKYKPLASEPSGTQSLRVFIDEGAVIEWTQVENFLSSEATDNHFRVEIDENDNIDVIFGDGVNGRCPVPGVDNCVATYRTGGGSEGNQVGKTTLSKLNGSFPFVVSITNPAAPSGGLPKETIAEAKVRGPASLKAMERCLTDSDYAVMAMRVPGVRRAYAYRAASYEEHVVVAAGGSNPVPTGTWNPWTEVGTGLRGAVGSYLLSRKPSAVFVEVDPVQVVDVLLTMVVYALPNVRRVDVLRSVEAALLAGMDITSQEFDQSFPQSLVYALVENVLGVDYCDLVRFQRYPYARHLSGLSDVLFGSFIVEGATLNDILDIRFVDATTYRVTSSISGTSLTMGAVGIPFTISGATFTATVGVVPPNGADRFQIVLGEYVQNIIPALDEMCRLQDSNMTLTVVGGLT